MIKFNQNNNNPLVSIIMSVYNSEMYIGDCVQSILNQTYSNFELIIIDDNSGDDTYNILSSFKDERIILYKNYENKGLTKNLNFAINKCKGKYIMRIDSDDICCFNRIEKQVFCMENEDVDVLGSNAYLIDVNNKILGVTNEVISNKDICDKMLLLNPMIHPTIMFKGSSLKKFMYNEDFKSCQDFELWTRMCGKVVFKNLRDPLIFYRINPDGITRLAKKKIDKRVNLIKKILFDFQKKYNIILSDSELDSLIRVILIDPNIRNNYDKISEARKCLNTKFGLNIYKYISFLLIRYYCFCFASWRVFFIGFFSGLIYYLRILFTRINLLCYIRLKKSIRN